MGTRSEVGEFIASMLDARTRRVTALAPKKILLTGATGYVGGQLLPRLLEAGHEVRCVVRSPEHADLPEGARVVGGDVLSGEGLDEAAAGADVAYYLVHSMGGSDSDGATDAPRAPSAKRWPVRASPARSTSAA
jgi:uncharacterized protein YbjT (DUF2867 family)